MTPGFSTADLQWLLRRPARRLLTAADRLAYRGRRVLVTGAGGSIGSALAQELARCAPSTLTLVDHSELHLFEIERALAERGAATDPALVDVSRPGAFARVCRRARPEVVFHAAAYKHVAMLERDVCAAVVANVLGTAAVAAAARSAGARLVVVSSDKAAAPRSIMGATKRLAEQMALAEASAKFRPIVVRFGNVLGSSGSLVAILRDRVRRGLPIQLTDPAATRYFMTADEAVALMLKADRLARGPATYWLDMGKPVAIGALATRLLALEAAAGFATVPIEITGLRPGEKRREELTSQGVRLTATRHRRILTAHQPPADPQAVRRHVARLGHCALDGDAADALDVLCAAVPDFVPSPEALAIARRGTTRTLRRSA